MKVLVKRTAMIGGGLSYDLYVPESECPNHVLTACPNGSYYTRTIFGDFHKKYLDFESAIEPIEHTRLEPGLERWASYKEHHKRAQYKALLILWDTFPETRVLTEFPLLWRCGLMTNETSAEKWIEYES